MTPLVTIPPSVNASMLAQASSGPDFSPPPAKPHVTVGARELVWDTYVSRRDAALESREFRGYARHTQTFDYDTCRPELMIFDAPCNEHTLAVVEFQAWRWDLAARYLKIHARNRPAEDDVRGWWAWHGQTLQFLAELEQATNLSGPGARVGLAKTLGSIEGLTNAWESQTGLPLVVYALGDSHRLRKGHGACTARFDMLAEQVAAPSVTSFRVFAADFSCGHYARNSPMHGRNGQGRWVTALGFPAFKQYARAFAEAYTDLRPFPDVLMEGMERWFKAMEPFVCAGALDVTPEEWAKLQTKVSRARSAAVANNASSAVLALAAAVGSVNALAGVLVGLFGLLLRGVGALLSKVGASGGHQCPPAPFLRTLSSRGCDTSRIAGNSELLETLMNMDVLTPSFTLVPKQYRPEAPASSEPLYITPPPITTWDLPAAGKSSSVVPQLFAGAAAVGVLALILRKATT